jgi:hypothetical protein
MKIGDFVSYFKGKHFAAHRWGYVEKINKKTAKVIVFYQVFAAEQFLAFSHDLIPLEWLRVEKSESHIQTKWGILSIQEIYQKACLDHKAAVDEMRTHAEPGHVVAPEDFILDPREVLMNK